MSNEWEPLPTPPCEDQLVRLAYQIRLYVKVHTVHQVSVPTETDYLIDYIIQYYLRPENAEEALHRKTNVAKAASTEPAYYPFSWVVDGAEFRKALKASDRVTEAFRKVPAVASYLRYRRRKDQPDRSLSITGTTDATFHISDRLKNSETPQQDQANFAMDADQIKATIQAAIQAALAALPA
ncbi:MAG: hypothetical protein L6R37_008454, partial [Teloschistes peruensis]